MALGSRARGLGEHLHAAARRRGLCRMGRLAPPTPSFSSLRYFTSSLRGGPPAAVTSHGGLHPSSFCLWMSRPAESTAILVHLSGDGHRLRRGLPPPPGTSHHVSFFVAAAGLFRELRGGAPLATSHSLPCTFSTQCGFVPDTRHPVGHAPPEMVAFERTLVGKGP